MCYSALKEKYSRAVNGNQEHQNRTDKVTSSINDPTCFSWTRSYWNREDRHSFSSTVGVTTGYVRK